MRSVVAFVVSAAAVAALAIALAGWLRGPAGPGVLAAAAGVVMLYLEPLRVGIGLGLLAAAVALQLATGGGAGRRRRPRRPEGLPPRPQGARFLVTERVHEAGGGAPHIVGRCGRRRELPHLAGTA